MIMQQNEIERSRFHYTVSREPSAASLQRQQRTKSVLNTRNPIPPARTSPEPFTFSIPIAPAITHAPNPTEYAQSTLKSVPIAINSKSSRLTEANVTEHNRFLGTIPSYHATKRDNLLRWVREILPHDRSSSPVSEQEMSVEFSYGTTSIPIQRHDLMHSNRSMMLTQNSNPSGKTNASVAESSTATDTHGKSSPVSLPFATSNQNTRPSAKPTAGKIDTPAPPIHLASLFRSCRSIDISLRTIASTFTGFASSPCTFVPRSHGCISHRFTFILSARLLLAVSG